MEVGSRILSGCARRGHLSPERYRSTLVERFPDVLADSSRDTKERVSLRYLEEFAGTACKETPPPLSTTDAPTSSYAAGMNAAKTCEEVLRSWVMLHEDSTSNGFKDGKLELLDGYLHQFILLKKATLPKSSIELLKERVLGSHYECTLAKDYNGFPNDTRHYANHFSHHTHRDHDVKKKSKKTMMFSRPWLNKLGITRKYLRLKNKAKTSSIDNGIILEKSSCSTHHDLANDYVDDQKRNEENVDDDHNEIQPLTMVAIETKTASERSTGFHDANLHCSRDTSACHDDAHITHQDNMKTTLRPGQQYQKQTVLHEDGLDLHGKVVGTADKVVKMLERSSMPGPSPVQGLCTKCGKSGQLLICRGDDCSRAIHESCLGSLARFDKDGHFYCLFCAYRNAFVIYKKAKKKALIARRNIFRFYDCGPEVSVLKQGESNAKLMINHNGKKQHNVTSNEQSTTNSSEKPCHNGILIEEENCTIFSDVGHHEVTENQPNYLNSSTDVICKNLHPCRELTECHEDMVVQGMPLNLHCEADICPVLKPEAEEQHPVEDHALPACDISPIESFQVCREPLQVEQRKDVNADAGQECLSVQANKSSTLMVEELNEHADVADQGPLYMLADICSALMVEKESDNVYVADEESLYMLANISSILLMEKENMHADAYSQERPSQADKISALKMDDEFGHPSLNLQGETDAYQGLIVETENQQHVERHGLVVNDSFPSVDDHALIADVSLPSGMSLSCNRGDDGENSFKSEVCKENMQMHAAVDGHKFCSVLANISSTVIVEEENVHVDVADKEPLSMQPNKTSTLVVEKENVHDVAEQARLSWSHKSPAMKMVDECGHHLFYLQGEIDACHELRDTVYPQPVEDHALRSVDDNLSSEISISCSGRVDCQNTFGSKVYKEDLQEQRENVVVDIHVQELPSKYANKSTILVMEEENKHTDVSDQEQPSQPVRSALEDECSHVAKRKALAFQIKERFSKKNRRNEDITRKSDFCQATVKSMQANSSFGNNVRRCAAQKKQSSMRRRARRRRSKCFWKPEEEKLLEEIMQRAWNMEEGRISWKKILEVGQHVFNGSRTPADLKDKWKGMLRKEITSRD